MVGHLLLGCPYATVATVATVASGWYNEEGVYSKWKRGLTISMKLI